MISPAVLRRLRDIAASANDIHEFIENRDYDDYLGDALFRSAIERKMTIIGEALKAIRDEDRDVATRILDIDRIIAMRHILVHGYSEVDDDVVWSAAKDKVPDLRT